MIYNLAIGLFITAAASLSFAVKNTDAAVKKKISSGAQLERNMSFDDLLVQGKYQFSDEAVVTVEQDKVLDALLGVRKDFKDKIKRSAAKN